MRVIIAYFTIFIVSLSFLVITDVVTGMQLSEALDVLKESFDVFAPGEYWIIGLLVLFPILLVIAMKFKKNPN
ncbi:hypothetical protein ABE504_33025 [Paenibacillus oryzisoli]|uniref:hypothetical protein n=1 Tax=Paenibacillus oryzisoli TaxID=1850517 RepID=UPI003D2B0395